MKNIMRALSVHEASFPVYAELAPGGGNIVVCLRLEGELSAEQAEEGFKELMAAEVSLRMGCQWLHPKGELENYYFVEADNSELPFKALTLEDDGEGDDEGGDNIEESIKKVRTALLNQPFQHGHLLWRARLVSKAQQHCLVFCINHCVSDGTSVYYFMNRWLQALSKTTPLAATRDEPELPLWHYMPPKVAGFFGAFRSLGILSTFMKAQKLADQGLSFKVSANVPIMEHRCRSTFRTLDKQHFSRLIKQVKENDKSIHGLISSAMLNTLLLDCKKGGRLENIKRVFSIPFVTTVNVRDKITPMVDDSVAGCLSSGVTSMVRVDKTLIDSQYQQSPWPLGDQVASGVTDALNDDQHWKVLRVYKLAGLKGLKKMFIDSSEKSLATPISFANLGRVNFDGETDTLSVTGYEAYAAFHASGAGVNIAASSLKGALTICFTSPDPVLNQGTLNAYADAVIEQLKRWSE